MKNCLLLFISLAISLIAGELIIRFLELAPGIGKLNLGHYQLSSNPLIRFEYKKNAHPMLNPISGSSKRFERLKQLGIPSQKISKEDEEAFVRANLWDTFHTNSWGFCDQERSCEKPLNTVRIAILGDSITVGSNVGMESRFSGVLENLLNQQQSGNTKYEIINFGVAGYDSVQEVAIIGEKVLPFSPDIVILAYCLNDNIPGADGSLYRLLLEKQPLKTRKWIHIEYRDFHSPIRSLLNRSDLYKYLRYKYFFYFKREHAYERELWQNPTSRNIVNHAFAMLSNLQNENQFKVLIVIFPYFKNLEKYPYMHLHEEVARVTEIYRFKLFDLYPLYRLKAREGGKEFRDKPGDFCHPNEMGHQIAGEAIYNALKQNFPHFFH